MLTWVKWWLIIAGSLNLVHFIYTAVHTQQVYDTFDFIIDKLERAKLVSIEENKNKNLHSLFDRDFEFCLFVFNFVCFLWMRMPLHGDFLWTYVPLLIWGLIFILSSAWVQWLTGKWLQSHVPYVHVRDYLSDFIIKQVQYSHSKQ